MVSRGGSPSRLLGKVRSPGWEERTCVVSLVQLVTCVSDLLAPGSSPSLTPKASTESGVGVKEAVLNPDAGVKPRCTLRSHRQRQHLSHPAEQAGGWIKVSEVRGSFSDVPARPSQLPADIEWAPRERVEFWLCHVPAVWLPMNLPGPDGPCGTWEWYPTECGLGGIET